MTQEQPVKRLLLVDDEPDMLTFESTILAKDGYGVDTAADGLEALDRLGAVRYDAILLDILMPGIDGYEIARRVRNLPLNRKTPIIMVTGSARPDAMRLGLEAGAVVFLHKPFNTTTLRSVVRSVLG